MCGGNTLELFRLFRKSGLSPRVRGKHLRVQGEGELQRSIPACAGETSAGGGRCRHRRVYPRVCGGNKGGGLTCANGCGLSPRVRGKPPHPFSVAAVAGSIPACAGGNRARQPPVAPVALYPRVCGGKPRRLVGGRPFRRSIPACAGETCCNARETWAIPVYPRVCGGNPDIPPPVNTAAGLSPRVRGKPSWSSAIYPWRRSIPACAGETRRRYGPNAGHRVYPRVCGGNRQPYAGGRHLPGLSPRVRGKLRYRLGSTRPSGSIPACAGETSDMDTARRKCVVYPRVCGGNSTSPAVAVSWDGLSPRVRGKPRDSDETQKGIGSIPACAGETRPVSIIIAAATVYPRVCGGNAACSSTDRVRCGLSPRVRGKLIGMVVRPLWMRSIPACAGETCNQRQTRQPLKVYPRVCGGNTPSRPGLPHDVGLSPRVRGKPARPAAAIRPRRSIPACAGETVAMKPPSTGRTVYPRVCGGNPSAGRLL